MGLEVVSASKVYPFVHCLNAITLNVVLQHNGILSALHTLNDIFKNLILGLGIAGIPAVNIPVKILEALCLNRLSQFRHNTGAVFLAYRIGAAAGESHQGSKHAGLILNDFLHSIQVFKEGFRAGVNGFVVMGNGVNCNGMSSVHDFLQVSGRGLAHDKEGCPSAILFKQIRNCFCIVTVWSVIKGQRNLDQITNLHLAGCTDFSINLR